MKAITCSQCGALIGDISLEKKIARCNYCGANLHPTDENIFDIPRKEAIQIVNRFEKTHKPIQPQNLSKRQQRTLFGIIIGTTLIPLIISGVVFIGIFSVLYFVPQIKTEVGIQARAERIGGDVKSLNFDKLVYPKYSIFDLPTWDEEELKKTVFKERRIEVKAAIDKEGKIVKAEALNGQEFLKNMCEKSALETTFFTPAPSEVNITYLFYVKDVGWSSSD